MSTDIEWTDETWNPVTGCTKVSPGCDHCYAERVTERFHGQGSFEQILLHPDRLDKPLHWRKPRRIFVNSMSDLFHERVPMAFIAHVFAVMGYAPQHTFQVLTKRHGRMHHLMRSPEFWHEVGYTLTAKVDPTARSFETLPLPNVHLGVSVEDQHWADIRIPALLDTPAAVRFISAEPLLGPVSLRWAKWAPLINANHLDGARMLDWVIVGGESGPGARPMDPQWARALRDQCVEAGVPFLFKQWGGIRPKAGGRELDGRTWDEYPAAVNA